MPNIEFLEEYALYRKFIYNLPESLDELNKVNINMRCPNCKETRTFRFLNHYLHEYKQPSMLGMNYPTNFNLLKPNYIIHLNYVCAACEKFNRTFSLRIGEKKQYIEKVGQYPPWDISIKKKLRNILGEFSDYYKKGLICESHAYGIGANIYYRRIVDEIIGELLEDIKAFLDGEDRKKYEKVLEDTKKSKNAQDKIKLVKNLIPPILMIGSHNPLELLYKILSEGIHKKTDEECLEDAHIIRKTFVFLINNIIQKQKDKQEYYETMKLLEKKAQKKGNNNQ